MKQEKLTVRDLAQIAIVAAIYVALTITPPLNAISYGAYQFRISEMMNFMAFSQRATDDRKTNQCLHVASQWDHRLRLPVVEARQAAVSNTFRNIAAEWHKHRETGLTGNHAARV